VWSGFRRTGKAMGQVYECWWRICREINVFFRFECHVLGFISICGPFTGSPSYHKLHLLFILVRCKTFSRPICFHIFVLDILLSAYKSTVSQTYKSTAKTCFLNLRF
jgi:hypothetical protein